jgi:hypothetical protein
MRPLAPFGPRSGIAFEPNPVVFQLTERNLEAVGSDIELMQGDFASLLPQCYVPPRSGVIVLADPPSRTALAGPSGLDLRRSHLPILKIINAFESRYASRRLLFAIRGWEGVDPGALLKAAAILDWSVTKTYARDANPPAGDEGVGPLIADDWPKLNRSDRILPARRSLRHFGFAFFVPKVVRERWRRRNGAIFAALRSPKILACIAGN